MKPLVSGPEAKRYEQPHTDTFILFPYTSQQNGRIVLVSSTTLQTRFPRAWRYLHSFQDNLRKRENNSFDDEEWYRFGRNQNIDKQELAKLVVAQTVPNLRVSGDFTADKYLNNVRVNGILPATGCDLAFLLGVMNGPVADFVFRRIGKPKQGGWYEANKQFIAPLPVPRASPEQQAAIGNRARDLQERWTRRRELLAEAEARLGTLPRATYKPKFIWPELPDIAELKATAPKSVPAHERTNWAHDRQDEAIERRLEALQAFLAKARDMQVTFNSGELRLTADGKLVLGRIYLDAGIGNLAAVYWRYLLLKKPSDAKAFSRDLARVPVDHNSPAARQFVERVEALIAETEAIREAERDMNEALYRLYGLTDEERLLIENDCAKRPVL